MRRAATLLFCVGFLWGGSILHAVQETPAQPQQQLAMPDAEKIVPLLRSTLNTLNDAIQTGNYTVLRDRGAGLSRGELGGEAGAYLRKPRRAES